MKDSSGDLDHALRWQAEFPELTVANGNDAHAGAFFAAGGRAVITACSNVLPEELEALRAGDESPQAFVAGVRELVFGLPTHAALKLLLHVVSGIARSSVRPPLAELTRDAGDARRDQVRGAQERLGCPAVQLFATCLGDLALPGRGRRRRGAAARGGLRGRVPGGAGLLRAAGLQRRAPRGGAPGRRARSRARSRATAPVVVPVGLVRDDGRALPARAARRASRSRSGSSPPSSTRAGVRAAAAQRGADGRLPRLLPHAARAADLRRAAPAARGARAPSSCRCRARTSAAASAARSRCASPRSRSRWPTTSSPAPRAPRRSSPPIPAASCTCAAASEQTGGPARRPPRDRARAGVVRD